MNDRNDQRFWWLAEEDKVHERVMPYVRSLEEAQKPLTQKFLWNAVLYANCGLRGLDWSLIGRATGPGPQIGENVVQSVIDTAASKIAKNRPRPVFVTDGGDFQQQRKARGLSRFCEAIFQRQRLYDLTPESFRDGCVFGTGGVKVFDEDDEIRIERALVGAGQILVDEEECLDGNPLQIHERRFVDREIVRAMFPGKEFERAIETANTERRKWTSFRRLEGDQIVLVESIRLPMFGQPGLRTVCIEGATLQRKPWKRSTFPWVFYRWSKPLFGFYGYSLAELLTGHQLQINRLNKRIHQILERCAVPRTYWHASDANFATKLSNEVGQQVFYRSKQPVFETPRGLGGELFAELERVWRKAFELAGISQLSATGKKPGGIDSGKGLREYNDIETERFSIQALAYEDFHLQIARRVVDVAKEMYERGKDLKVTWRDRNLVRDIQWSEVDLDEDAYSMSLEAASLLSKTPAGRREEVMDNLAMGIFTPEDAKEHLGYTSLDVERPLSLKRAAIEDAEATIERLEDEDAEFPVPDPIQQLDLCIERVKANLRKIMASGAPEEVKQRHRDWLEQADALVKRAAQAMQQHAAPPPAPMDPAAQVAA